MEEASHGHECLREMKRGGRGSLPLAKWERAEDFPLGSAWRARGVNFLGKRDLDLRGGLEWPRSVNTLFSQTPREKTGWEPSGGGGLSWRA